MMEAYKQEFIEMLCVLKTEFPKCRFLFSLQHLQDFFIDRRLS
jgi:hypothetical protein